MKRHLTLLATLLVGWCGLLVAQTPQPSPTTNDDVPYEEQTFVQRFLNWEVPNLETKNEVRLGFPVPDFGFVRGFVNNSYGSGLQGDYLSSLQRAGTMQVYTSPLLQYMVRGGKRWEYGVSGFFAQTRQNLYDTTTSEVKNSLRNDIFVLSPTLRWNFIQASWIRFYFQMGLNCHLLKEAGAGAYYDSEIFVGYGYTVGKKLFFFSEGSYGDSIIVTMGIGYRF